MREVAGGLQPDSSRAGSTAKTLVRLSEYVNPLLRRDAREIADAKHVVHFTPLLVASQIDPERDNGDASGCDAQERGHHRNVKIADRNEVIDVSGLSSDQIDRLGLVGLDQIFE